MFLKYFNKHTDQIRDDFLKTHDFWKHELVKGRKVSCPFWRGYYRGKEECKNREKAEKG